ncbi:MAG: T9SS type A sorting domain-containing protein [Clostridia bacterium]|nr:T9SS type A sorting domain-containing protein [Clostridia bacterium]
MKKLILSATLVVLGLMISAQKQQLRPHLKFEVPIEALQKNASIENTPLAGELTPAIPSVNYKATNTVNIIGIGTSANAYSYGFAGGQRSMVCTNDALGVVTNIHRMGGALDPEGSSNNLGYDFSTNWGIDWSVMNEFYLASGHGPTMRLARYPQQGIFNPAGNTNPDDAYMVYLAPIINGSGSFFGDYVYGRVRIGDITDTTVNFNASNPGAGIYQGVPDGFTVTATGDFWALDYNVGFGSTGGNEWLQQLLISHGVWNQTEEDYDMTQFLLPCPTLDTTMPPLCGRVEFSPDGQHGYIVVLTDNGNVAISAGQSFYPVLWRTADYGTTWEGPIEVALAGEEGIWGVLNFLDAEEIEELYDPVPDPDEIPFTTAYDFDLSVGVDGNPCIAVVVGVTSEQPYGIITERSDESGYLYMAPFILHSVAKGNPGSWQGRELGRLYQFRGTYGQELWEDNRIQIARNRIGDRMFVAWLDTDTTISSENNDPDIWARGYSTNHHSLTYNGETLHDEPQNMTYGSEATYAAHFFALSNEVIYNDATYWPTYTLPMVYEVMDFVPSEPVEYRYIQNAFFWEQQFLMGPPPPGIIEKESTIAAVSEVIPNPATTTATFTLGITRPAVANVSIINLTGQRIKQFAQQLATGNNTISLEVAELKAGLYFCIMQVDGEQVTRKIVVE